MRPSECWVNGIRAVRCCHNRDADIASSIYMAACCHCSLLSHELAQRKVMMNDEYACRQSLAIASPITASLAIEDHRA